jgi:ABC-type Zn uptake system ZnuABC Zn-binding protein ZnuA
VRILALTFAALLFSGAAHATLRVVTTTTDLAALAAAVGGDAVSVESIVPPAVDPEAFEPRPRDLERLRNAALVVRVGLGYDYWLDALLGRIADSRLMRGGAGYHDASTGIPLLEIRGESVVNEGGHAHGVANPHYWLDPENAIVITAGIADALARIAPELRERIAKNRERFLAELAAHRLQWSAAMGPFKGARLIAFHNSWPYFSRRFRLDFIGFVEPRPGVAASPAHLAQLLAEARGAHVRAIVHESYAAADSSRLVAQKLDLPLVSLALSVDSVPGTGSYLALIDHDVNALAKALAKALAGGAR